MKSIYQKLFEIKKANIKLIRDTKAFNYKYATLSQIQEKLGDVLEEQNILITHRVFENKVITQIINLENEDEKITSEIEMSNGIKPQDKGSEITYYRRYNLLSLLDLEVEDDDGKSANDSKKEDSKEDNELPWLNDDNLSNLKTLKEKGEPLPTKEVVLKKYRVAKRYNQDLIDLGIFKN